MPNRMLRDGMIYSGRVNRVSATAEMLFVRIVLAADDFGLIEVDPHYLKSRCLPARDEIKAADVPALLAELMETELLLGYAEKGKNYAAVDKWEQRRNAKYPKCPLPPWGLTHIAGGYIDRKARTEGEQPSEEKKLKPSTGADKPERKSQPKARRLDTALPFDGERVGLPHEWSEWAGNNTPNADADAEWARFCDYWRAQPGQKGVKADWFATWRNWCRRASEQQKPGTYGQRQPNRQEALEQSNRLAAGLPPLEVVR